MLARSPKLAAATKLAAAANKHSRAKGNTKLESLESLLYNFSQEIDINVLILSPNELKMDGFFKTTTLYSGYKLTGRQREKGGTNLTCLIFETPNIHTER